MNQQNINIKINKQANINTCLLNQTVPFSPWQTLVYFYSGFCTYLYDKWSLLKTRWSGRLWMFSNVTTNAKFYHVPWHKLIGSCCIRSQWACSFTFKWLVSTHYSSKNVLSPFKKTRHFECLENIQKCVYFILISINCLIVTVYHQKRKLCYRSSIF